MRFSASDYFQESLFYSLDTLDIGRSEPEALVC
jgi:hypothetical protein